MEDNCLFCKIIKREVSADIVYEDDYVLAFKDIHPMAMIHILVVPKIHIKSMNEITEENVEYMPKIFLAIKEIAKKLNIDERGYRVICNCGKDGGQVVNHIHFHLLGGQELGPKIVCK